MKVTASFIQSTQLQLKQQFDRMVIPGVVVASDIKVTVKTSNRNSCLNVFKSRYADSSFATMANSTILTPAAAAARVGIQPTIEAAPAFVWKWLWKGHQMLLPLLHITDDSNQPPVRNNDLSLWVLWNKAIAAQDKKSPVYDNDWTYDMLPSVTRYFVKSIPNQLFPRLYHANIEIRTAYLNQIILQEMIRNVNENKKVRIVSIGAGYDVRCSRLLSLKHPNDSSKHLLTEAWEIDVPDVIQPKASMLHRLQYRRQRQRQDRDDEPIRVPHVRPVDLNNSTWFENVLNAIIRNDDGDETWHTIFVSEAVFIYLDKGIPRKVMQQCRDAIIQSGTSNTASFCFADRLENSPGIVKIQFCAYLFDFICIPNLLLNIFYYAYMYFNNDDR